MSKKTKLTEARSILVDLGLPRPQLNDRTALCLLALVDVIPGRKWSESAAPLMGITPIMDWAKKHYGARYAPNTRETFRRQSMHQFVAAGICRYNPDDPDRAVNSPSAVYQIEPTLHSVLKSFGTKHYRSALAKYLGQRETLIEQYAKARRLRQVPVKVNDDQAIKLSPGAHSRLIREIVEEFGSRYAPGGEVIYIGDTGDKFGYFDKALLLTLGVDLDDHGKLPDVIIYLREKNWLLLIESVTSHGPVESKRQIELVNTFENCTAGLVFVSAFPDRKTFLKYIEVIAWESEVWIANSPSHMIHFNGARFLGPY